MDVLTALRERRSLYKFTAEPVPYAAFERAVEAARWAPNHKLTEPWRFYWLGPETCRHTVDLVTEIITEKKGAEVAASKRADWLKRPAMFVASYTRTPNDPLRDEEDYAATACALQNLTLALWAEGLGGKWGSGAIIRDERFYRLLGIDAEKERIVALYSLGYPAEVPRSRRKPVEDILQQLP